MDDIPPDEVLPCGCVVRCIISDDVRTLVIIPCTQGCPNYHDMIEMALEDDLPVEYRQAP